MQILSLNFYLYTISGLWRPIEWPSKCSKILYSMFTCFIMYLLIILIPIELLDILLIENMDDFAMNSLILLSIVNVLVKATTVITHRDELVNLVEKLQKKPCKAYNEEENNIQMKFDRMIRSYSVKYTFLSSCSAIGAILGAIFNILKGQLPFRMRELYDYTLPPLFWFISIQELMSIIVGTIVNVATETTVLGFCLQICAQIEILKYRLQRMIMSSEKKETPRISLIDESNETGRLSEHILHHLCIIRLAKMINKVFSKVIFVQFFDSICVLCTSLYYLSSHVTIINMISFFIPALCMLVQIFVYCWAGNEVILKSTGLSAAMYEMDWISMPINKQKDLLMIMKRSTRPIKFTSSFFVTLSLKSYGSLLKASYSTFNLLRHS